MGPGQDRLGTPGSAVGLASVARHVTDCATWPSDNLLSMNYIFIIAIYWFQPRRDFQQHGILTSVDSYNNRLSILCV